MSWLSIGLREGEAIQPGGRVRGTAAWMLDSPPRSVTLHLLWHTEGKGTLDVEVVATRELGDAGEGSADFDLLVPVGPWSFSGRLVSLLWQLELVAEPDLGVERVTLVVAPGGREVRLHGAGETAEG